MREIPITSDGLSFRPDAFFQLIVHAFFPESEVDRLQALFLADMEARRYATVGVENYQPSFLLKLALDRLERRTAKLMIVGLVTLEICRLSRLGHTASVERAARVVQGVIDDGDEVRWLRVYGPKPIPQRMKASRDLSDIKSTFREYRSVAHIHAARMTATHYSALLPMWERAPIFENCVIATAAEIQQQLTAAIDTTGWNLWHLPRLPAEADAYPPLDTNTYLATLLEASEERLGISQG